VSANDRSRIKKGKAELHCEMIESVLSKGGTLEDDVEMYQYIIEQASRELARIVIEKN
jgi:hypothetical protein